MYKIVREIDEIFEKPSIEIHEIKSLNLLLELYYETGVWPARNTNGRCILVLDSQRSAFRDSCRSCYRMISNCVTFSSDPDRVTLSVYTHRFAR